MDRRWFLGATATLAAAWPALARADGPRRGGILKCIAPEPTSFDVHAVSSEATALLSSLVRRTLFKRAAGPRHGPGDFTLVPDLALRADITREGRTYTLALRPGVRWEDKSPLRGRELSAADVKFSLERLHRRGVHAGLLGPLEAVEIADRLTLRVHLTEPFAPLLANLAEPWTAVIPRELDDRPSEARGAEGLIGCGPFTLERFEPGVKAVLARNPGYHARGLPYLDRVEWLFIKDPATRLSLFRARQVDLPAHDGRIPRSEAAAFRRADPAYPVAGWDPLTVGRLALRVDRPPLSDVRVRRALSLALDRKRWVRELLDGQGVEEPGPVPAAMRDWKLVGAALGDGARWLAHDPALARRLLAEAGHASGLRLRCAIAAGSSPDAAVEIERLAASLKAVGVQLQLVIEDPSRLEDATWLHAEPHTDVDGHLYGTLRSGQPANRGLVSDPRLDALLEAQRRTVTRRDRKWLVDDIQRWAMDQVLCLYPPAPRQMSSWAPALRHYAPKTSLDRGAQLEGVWLARRG
ncbi:MAG TPA: ABC transporter substrate-binding protein [Methylomirabilota bacterium]|nr:ABC transporter substrate-binding protein [Methylomirabilota bacterium]